MTEAFGGAALVTGASSGIGAAFARALAARGMDLVLVARRRPELEALAAACAREHGVRTLVLAEDLAAPEAPARVLEATRTAGWTVGLLVNNAGFGVWAPFEQVPPERSLQMVDLNCRAPVHLTHAFLPGMLERGKGGLVFLASIAAYQPTPYFAAYGATKAFNLWLAEALWAELRPRGIAVLGVSPGYTETGFQAAAGSEDGPRGPAATPEEVAEAALAQLGHGPSFVHGAANALLAIAGRAVPRAAVVAIAERVSRPPAATLPRPSRPAAPPAVAGHGFSRAVLRLLLVFAAVAAVDLAFLSAFTGQWRVWFPVWLDPGWASRPRPWVVYSQSYLAGVLLIPALAVLLEGRLLRAAPGWARAAFWAGVLGLGAFLAWWKGGLMLAFGKVQEALGWAVLTLVLAGVVRAAEALGARRTLPAPGTLLRALALGLAGFFLGMAVLDPVLQLGVQGLPFSGGLGIEMGFFVPAGLLLLWLARRR